MTKRLHMTFRVQSRNVASTKFHKLIRLLAQKKSQKVKSFTTQMSDLDYCSASIKLISFSKRRFITFIQIMIIQHSFTPG